MTAEKQPLVSWNDGLRIRQRLRRAQKQLPKIDTSVEIKKGKAWLRRRRQKLSLVEAEEKEDDRQPRLKQNKKEDVGSTRDGRTEAPSVSVSSGLPRLQIFLDLVDDRKTVEEVEHDATDDLSPETTKDDPSSSPDKKTEQASADRSALVENDVHDDEIDLSGFSSAPIGPYLNFDDDLSIFDDFDDDEEEDDDGEKNPSAAVRLEQLKPKILRQRRIQRRQQQQKARRRRERMKDDDAGDSDGREGGRYSDNRRVETADDDGDDDADVGDPRNIIGTGRKRKRRSIGSTSRQLDQFG